MARLTKAEAKKHAEAVALLDKDVLTDEDKEFFRGHWQESAEHVNSAAGVFFTPWSQALDFALEFAHNGPTRIIDLCAGIGNLAAAVWARSDYERRAGLAEVELVCVELNPAYVAIGKKLLPEARWLVGSIFDLPDDLGHFDVAISNPPFGNVNRGGGGGPRFTGSEFEYHVIDVAADLAENGAFILPAMSAPFRYSGAPFYEWRPQQKYEKFAMQTGIELGPGIGVDTTCYADEWHGVKVPTEHCLADFAEWREGRKDVAKAVSVVEAPAVSSDPVKPDEWADVFAAL